MPRTYLRFQDDYLEDAKAYQSKSAAIEAYRETMEELGRFGQRIEASLHIANSKAELAEYPDFVLSPGPRGGVRVEST
jgi:hypothetical protein